MKVTMWRKYQYHTTKTTLLVAGFIHDTLAIVVGSYNSTVTSTGKDGKYWSFDVRRHDKAGEYTATEHWLARGHDGTN